MEVAYDSGNGDVYVANSNCFGPSRCSAGTVSVISGTSVVATISVGNFPIGVAYDPENGYVYVANFNSNSVSVISETSVVATVGVGGGPEGVAYDSGNGEVYVANYNSNSVSVISGTSVVATVSSGTGPFRVTYDSANGDVYVSDYFGGSGNTVNVISGVSNTLVATVSVGSGPIGISYDSADAEVYVANTGPGTVSVISGTSLVATISVGANPTGVGYDSGNGDVYVANSGSNTVSVISGTNVVATVGVGGAPEGVAYDSGNGDVYVANYGSNSVSVISTILGVGDLGGNLAQLSPSVTGRVSVPNSPLGIAYDSGNGDVYVATGTSQVSVISGTAVTANLSVGNGPREVAYDAADGYVYVANYYSANVSILSGTGVQGHIATGTNPYGVGYDSGNQEVYVTNLWSDNVTVISGTTVAGTVPLGTGTAPMGIAYDSGNGFVYVADSGSNRVSVLSGTTVVATIPVGGSPYGVVYDSGNQFVYVTNSLTNNVSVISGTSVVATFRVGSSPYGATYDAGDGLVLVANDGSGNVSLITGTSVVGAVSVGTYPFEAAYDPAQGVSYVTVQATNSVAVLSAPWEMIAPPGLEMDAGQTLNLTAPLLYPNPGVVSGLSAAVTPMAGLDCMTLSATESTVGMICTATTAGTYSVKLTAFGTQGGSVWSGTTVTVYTDPSVSVPVSIRPSADVGQPVFFSTSAKGGPGAYLTYQWSAPATLGCTQSTTNTLTCVPTAPVPAGTVSVNVTDANNYTSATSSLSYTVSADPTISGPVASVSTLDVGQSTSLSVTATNGTGLPSTYSWSGLPAGCASADTLTLTCTPTSVGTYAVSVTITDSNGVTISSGATTLIVSPTLGTPVLASSVSALDVGQTVTFSVTVSGGSAPLTYTWSGLPAGCVSGDSATLTCSPTVAGPSTVSVNVTDANGVTGMSNAVKLVVSPRLSPGSIALSSGILDLGQTTNLTVTVSGGSGGLSYQWTGLPSGCAAANKATVDCTPTTAGTAWVSVAVTDSNGAMVTVGPISLVTSPALGAPTVVASVSTVQVGASVTFTTSVSGGTVPLSYRWIGLPQGCATVNAPIVTCVPTETGTFTVSVTVTDAAGTHTSSAGLSVTVTKAPTPAATGLSNGLDWGILALAVVALVIAILGVLLMLRKGGKGENMTTNNHTPLIAHTATDSDSVPDSKNTADGAAKSKAVE